MKQSLKHMFEISGGISLCFLISAVTAMLAIEFYEGGYGYMFIQSFWELALAGLILSVFGVFLVDYNWSNSVFAKRLMADDD